MKYYIERRLSSYWIYIDKQSVPMHIISSLSTPSKVKMIDTILFLKNIKLVPYYDKEISEDIFNLIKKI